MRYLFGGLSVVFLSLFGLADAPVVETLTDPVVVTATHRESLEVATNPAEEFKTVVEELAPKAHDYGCDTYPIRARGYRTDNGQAAYPSGSCVSVGKGQFLTAAHIVRGLQTGYVVEIQIDGEWHKTTAFQASHDADIAKAVIAKEVSGVSVRPIVFGEAVTVYGLTTCEPMAGVYAGDRHVGLKPSTQGVNFGDSGGGVYGEDGSLVGLVSGYGDDRRSVFISAIDKIEEEPKAKQAAPVPQVQSCPNGQCQRVQGYQMPKRRKR